MNSRHVVTLLLLALAGAVVGWSWPQGDTAPAPAPSPSAGSGVGLPEAAPEPPTPEGRHSRELVAEPLLDEPLAEPTPVGALLGLVVDASGQGIAGASVSAVPTGGAPPDNAALATTTDAHGTFRLADLPVGRYRVRAAATDTIAAVSPAVTVTEDGEVRVETLRLTPGVTLRGVVVTSGGEPIAAATVQAGNEGAPSGPDGRFAVAHLPPGPCTVTVRAEGMLGWRQANVDPAQELRVVLPAGLVVTGTVRDARTGEPVESFAVHVRRLRSLGEVRDGPPAWQLRHKLEAAPANAGADAGSRAIQEEYAQRLARIEAAPAAACRPPADFGPPDAHPEGRFTVDRLDEGLCELEVLSPAHQFARSAPFALRRGEAAPELQLALEPACSLQGSVRTLAGEPLAGAVVEVVRASAQPDPTPGSRFAWALGEPVPEGDLLATAVADATGAFAAGHLPPGPVHVLARHPRACTAASPQLVLPSERDVELRLADRPALEGRVHGVPAGRAAEVLVTIAGGASNLRSVGIDADGCYAFEGLEPGEYVVRAAVGPVAAREADFVHSVFANAAGPPERQLALRAGERRAFDVTLVLPPTGSVHGSVRLNGQPAPGCRITILVPDSARPLTAVADALGGFALQDVPAGEVELRVHVRAGGMQEVQRERVQIAADRATSVQVEAATGGIVGRVFARDGTPDIQLDGDVLLLPGCSDLPADLAAHRREHRVHQLTVRGGTFRGDVVTAGRSLAVVRIRNRAPAAQVVDVPVAALGNLELACGPAR